MNVDFNQFEQLINNTSTTSNLHLIPGEYLVKVYQQTSTTNLNPALSQGQIYQIMGKVSESEQICVDEPPYDGGMDDEWIVYDDCLPTPAVDTSPTPTPSITASVTPTPTVTPTIPPSPSVTATNTATPTTTPTTTLTQTQTPTSTPFLEFCIDSGFDYQTNGSLFSTGNTMYIWGGMEFYDNNDMNKVVRLNSINGKMDNNFVPAFADSLDVVYDVAEDSGGNLIIVGDFQYYNGEVRGRIVKIDNTGKEISSFSTGTGFNNPVYGIILDEANNALYVWGGVYCFQWNKC